MPVRRSGVLLHPTSLPGPGGIGTLGPELARFLERLRDAGQSVWQVLPLGPTGFGDSPYQSFSAFAGNPLLISPERLLRDGLVGREDVDALSDGSPDRVDFGAVIPERRELLAKAYRAFADGAADHLRDPFSDFRQAEASWLDDFALFTAVHEEDNRAWVDWPEELAGRDGAAVAGARDRHAEAVASVAFQQFLFQRDWDAVRDRARGLGIRILGDLPLFVAHDSADVWANRGLFDLDGAGMPRVLAGAPPDDFTEDGQLWGNPLYRWDRLRETGFDWWVRRVRACLRQCDRLRLDHFRGFAGCWATPAGETTARNGEWVPVPGGELFDRLRDEIGELPIVAEDLGEITPDVNELRDRFGFPGMKILQFAFGDDPKTNEFAPHNFPRASVVYPGTHDNETMQGWWNGGGFVSGRPADEVAEERKRILALTGTDGAEIHWDFARLALASVADTAIVSVQDLLGLGNEARMNSPGTSDGNWVWRMGEEAWTDDVRDRLAALTEASGRWPA